jgi:hypothetical protein
MSLFRWLVTIVAFPLGGLLAIQVASTADGPLPAALAGGIAGAVIGLAQWLALRPGVNPLWIPVTAAALAAGLALGVLAIGSATGLGSLALLGAIAGLTVGGAQSLLLRAGILRSLLWAAAVGASWTIAWVVTSLVIVDEQRGYATFGLSGALVATVLTGVALRGLLGARAKVAS